MKYLFFLLSILFLASCAAHKPAKKQTVDTGLEFMADSKVKYNWKQAIAPVSLAFVSGVSSGVHETLMHHYDRFDRRFPNANPNFWNPKQSWYNKYQGGDPKAGPAYFGATSFLVATTDGYHLTNLLTRGTLFAAGCTIIIGERRPWWHHAVNIGLSYVAFGAGFNSTYSLFFK